MSPQSGERNAVLREAQEWVRVLPTAGLAQRLQFVRWIKSSPKNLTEYLLLTALDTEAAGMRSATEFDLDSILPPFPDKAIALHTSAAPRSPWTVASHKLTAPGIRRRAPPFAALAAFAALLALGCVLRSWHLSRWNHAEFGTDIGERRTLTLPDGSRVQLNTDSAVQLHYTPDRRELSLLRGEAQFQVATDFKRPFEVEVGPLKIRDIGTVFNVRVEPRKTTVYVVAGRVGLRTAVTHSPQSSASPQGEGTEAVEADDALVVELTQGEEAVIGMTAAGASPLPRTRRLTPEEAESQIAWTRGSLVLVRASLAEVVAEINRYHARKILISDPELEKIQLGGMIDPAIDDYRILTSLLSGSCAIEVDDSLPGVVTLRRSHGAQRCSQL